MGRRRLPVEYIQDSSRRRSVFYKRNKGLFKKAYEISVLAGCDVEIMTIDEGGIIHHFCSDKVIPRQFDRRRNVVKNFDPNTLSFSTPRTGTAGPLMNNGTLRPHGMVSPHHQAPLMQPHGLRPFGSRPQYADRPQHQYSNILLPRPYPSTDNVAFPDSSVNHYNNQQQQYLPYPDMAANCSAPLVPPIQQSGHGEMLHPAPSSVEQRREQIDGNLRDANDDCSVHDFIPIDFLPNDDFLPIDLLSDDDIFP